MKFFTSFLFLGISTLFFASCSPKAGSVISGDVGNNSSAQQSQSTINDDNAAAKKTFAPKNPEHDRKYNYSLQPKSN